MLENFWKGPVADWIYGKLVFLNSWLWRKQYGVSRANVYPPFTHWFWNSKSVDAFARLLMAVTNFLWMKRYG